MQWRVSLGLVLAMLGPVGSVRAEPTERVEVIEIALDVADLPDTRVELARVVELELQRLLAEQPELPPGVMVADDRRLLVEVRPGPIPDSDDVLIRIEAQLDGQMLAESETESCMSCSNEQVARRALPMLQPLLEQFPAPVRRLAAKPSTSEADAAGDVVPSSAPSDRALSISGASALAVGLAGLGVGVGLIVVDERVVSEPGAGQLDVRKYGDPGIAVAVVGGALAITGAALLGVAFARRGRGTLTAGPLLAPEQLGLTVAGRF